MSTRRTLSGLCLLSVLTLTICARPFTVAVYNVENLFDVDGKAAYDEYQAAVYGPAQLRTKLHNISAVVKQIGGTGQGPDVLFLEEVEVDQTPSPRTGDVRAIVDAQASTTADKLLSSPLSAELADWPAEAWLLKSIEDLGLKGYTVVAGSDSVSEKHSDGHTRAIKNVVLTRLPIKSVRNLPISNARNILEVLVEVDGAPLYLFANHWKSGAGDPVTEKLRVENARVLRARLDEILAADPHADIIIGGDFNSQYNQKARYPGMTETGINDVLHSQGDELAVRGAKVDLYNLWYELPPEKRGSDTFRGEWGTLMQLMISRGLYDYRGVQYIDGSFAVVHISGLNEASDGTPIRWNGRPPAGSGFSDHYPIVAQFTTVSENSPGKWLELKNPSDGATPSTSPKVRATKADALAKAIDPASLPSGTDIRRDPAFDGKLFVVSGRPILGKRLAVEFMGGEFEVYVPNEALREQLREKWKSSSKLKFFGELGEYKGHWQFVIKSPEWFISAE